MGKRTGNYWKDFSPIWWDEIKLWYGWTDWINAMYRTGIQIGSIILVFVLGRSAENFFDSVIVKVAEWILTILLIEFSLTITYLRASQRLYVNQSTVLYDYQEKERLGNADLITFDIELGKDNLGNYSAGILISNHVKNTMFRNPTFTIESIEGGAISRLPTALELHLHNQFNSKPNFLTPGDAPSWFDLAVSVTRQQDGGAIKTNVTTNHIPKFRGGTLSLTQGIYKIRTCLIGSFDSSPFDTVTKREYWILTVRDDHSLDLKKADEHDN